MEHAKAVGYGRRGQEPSGSGMVLSLLEPGECVGIEGKCGRWARPDSMSGRIVVAGRARFTNFTKLFQYFTTLNLQNTKIVTLIQKFPKWAMS
jgi:hypothetical protein